MSSLPENIDPDEPWFFAQLGGLVGRAVRHRSHSKRDSERGRFRLPPNLRWLASRVTHCGQIQIQRAASSRHFVRSSITNPHDAKQPGDPQIERTTSHLVKGAQSSHSETASQLVGRASALGATVSPRDGDRANSTMDFLRTA